ncbi:MAG: beta-galactosidase, partial [Oscillospiraceae bacterium]|nr:beta-galactosidase [Oscillospiraceae bacterium]
GLGVTVPLIACDHTAEGDAALGCANGWKVGDDSYGRLLRQQPDTPKIITEFWNGLYTVWGAPRRNTHVDVEGRLMDSVCAGFTAINHYMFHGGTNFGSWGGRTVFGSGSFITTSYESDAPLDEYAGLTKKYMDCKRVGTFLRECGPFLMASERAEPSCVPTDRYSVRLRVHGGAQMAFVEGLDEERGIYHAAFGDGRVVRVTANPRQIVPAVRGYDPFGWFRMDCGAFFTTFRDPVGGDIVIIWGENGERTQASFLFDSEVSYRDVPCVSHVVTDGGRGIAFDLCHFAEMQVLWLESGGRALRVIVLDVAGIDGTWFDRSGGSEVMVTGCLGVGCREGGRLAYRGGGSGVPIRAFGATGGLGEGWDWDAGFGCRVYGPSVRGVGLSGWEASPEPLGKAARAGGGRTAATQGRPADFTVLGKLGGYLYYEAELLGGLAEAAADGDGNLRLILGGVQDPLIAYHEGVRVGEVRGMFLSHLDIRPRKGANRLGFLAQGMGRFCMTTFLGERKGMTGDVYAGGVAMDMRGGWEGADGESVDLDKGQPETKATRVRKIFDNIGHDKAFLCGRLGLGLTVNGHKVDLGYYEDWWRFTCADISAYTVGGENVVEMDYNRKHVDRLDLYTYDSSKGLGSWEAAEVADPAEARDFAPYAGEAPRTPHWYRCRFRRPVSVGGAPLNLRLRMTGMGKGFITLNGRGVGRFWQVGPQEDYKLPDGWLLDENELLIFDEEGRDPGRVRVFGEPDLGAYVEVSLP